MVRLKYSFKNDSYKKARGGYSRFSDISCVVCGKHICYYQKDGSGILKRLYIGRISDFKQTKDRLFKCPNCGEHLGNLVIYERENRPAFRLFVAAITKKIIKAR